MWLLFHEHSNLKLMTFALNGWLLCVSDGNTPQPSAVGIIVQECIHALKKAGWLAPLLSTLMGEKDLLKESLQERICKLVSS